MEVTADKRLRFGVLGTARIADAIIGGIRKVSNIELVAAASRDAEKAQSWAQERDIPLSFGSYEEMLASDKIDAVYIPLPNGLHKEWAINAALAGKHVLCEKPLAVNAGEVEEIIAATRRSGVTVMEAFMYRFHPQTERVKELFRSGAIGDPRIVRATFDFLLERPNDVRRQAELGGGALLDVGCYCVSALRYIVGAEPKSVTASAVWSERGGKGVDLTVVGTLEFPAGLLGTIDCSFQVGTKSQQGVTLSGSGGRITVPQPFRVDEQRASTITVDKADSVTPPEEISVPAAHEYALMVEHFAGAVLSGRQPSYTLEDSLANMRVLDGLREAARTGRRVDIDA